MSKKSIATIATAGICPARCSTDRSKAGANLAALREWRRAPISSGRWTRASAKSPSRKIKRKARLGTFDVIDEFLQSIGDLILVWSSFGGCLQSPGFHEVVQEPEQRRFLFASSYHR
jgi:hypothetical protein